MAAKSARDLLPVVRRYVLEKAAAGTTLLALSDVTFAVDQPAVLGNVHYVGRPAKASYGVSWSPQKRRSKQGRRGWVQACLSRLAKEGLMWERQRPECSVMHEPRDKYFRIRITQGEARRRLQ